MRPILLLTLIAAGCGASPATSTDDLGAEDLAITPGADALPAGAISFVRGGYCPEGWSPYYPARGRFLVPRADGGGAADAVGEALTANEDRVHGHTVSASVTLDKTSFVGAAGGGNGSPAASGALPIEGIASESPTRLPWLQLLVCKKTSELPPAPRPLPRGLMQFFDGQACPDGWHRPNAPIGRHLVGLPAGGNAGATFGGPPLEPGERRTHTHPVSATLAPASAGIALASGCCADGYAAHKGYPFQAESTPAEVGLPTIQLLLCEKS